MVRAIMAVSTKNCDQHQNVEASVACGSDPCHSIFLYLLEPTYYHYIYSTYINAIMFPWTVFFLHIIVPFLPNNANNQRSTCFISAQVSSSGRWSQPPRHTRCGSQTIAAIAMLMHIAWLTFGFMGGIANWFIDLYNNL